MKIKWKLGIFFGVFFVLLGVLLFYILKDKPKLLMASEIVMCIGAVIFFFILNRITRPIDQLALGLDAIKDQDFTGFLRPGGNQETDVLVEVYNKMLENIRKERVFQQEQHFFLQNLVQILPVGFLILDYDDKLQEFNPEAAKILNLTEQNLGKPIENKPLWKAILENEELIKTGGANYLRIYTNRFKHRGFYQRFVILEEAGDEVLQIEKQSYGKVIRMMAHEVKNSVGAINSILESIILAKDLGKKEQTEYLNMVVERNKMLNRFIDNFAKVVRLPLPEKKDINLSEIVERVFRLMKLRVQEKDIDFRLQVLETPVYMKASAEQMEQALINITLNAIEAIHTEGTISIKLDKESLSISDTGTGISSEVQENLFTPFFSTKPTGQGVGLTMVREILHNHGFEFNLSAEDGETRFEIRF